MEGVIATPSRSFASISANLTPSTRFGTPSRYFRRSGPGFYDSTEGWKCDCQPRLLARRWLTKKSNENFGRWFYRCPNSILPEGDCGFFLWIDEAHILQKVQAPNPSLLPQHGQSEGSWIRTQLPLPSPRRKAVDEWEPPTPSRSSKRPRDEVETDVDDHSDLENLGDDIYTSTRTSFSHAEFSTPDEDRPTLRAPNAETPRKELQTPRKERRTGTHTSPSRNSGLRTRPSMQSRLVFGSRDDDIFDIPAKEVQPMNSLMSKLVGAHPTAAPPTGFSRARNGFRAETPRTLFFTTAQSSALDDTPLRSRSEAQEFTEIQIRATNLFAAQTREAENYRKERDQARQELQAKSDGVVTMSKRIEALEAEIEALKTEKASSEKRIEELEAEKAASEQVNGNLRDELQKLRLESPK